MTINIEEIEDHLNIRIPSSEKLTLESSRRVTGPGLLWEKPGAILDVFTDHFDKQLVVDTWQEEIDKILVAIGWADSKTKIRIFDTGVNLAISATIDLLYSAVFVVETSWHLTACRLLEENSDDFDDLISDLKRVIAMEQNPPVLTVQRAAVERNIDVLWDDDYVSLGHGNGSEKWGINEIPAPEDVNWDALHNVPVALITGTNGKSTSVRLSTAIAEAAGLVGGSTSTDYVKLGEEVLDYGDYSGPGGARMLLRDRRLQIAYLEVARGGILRRGLPLRQASGAMVTNIAADHLGEYGINTVEHLADAKFAVSRTLSDDGVLVLNADDELVVANGLKSPNIICWFSLDETNEHIVTARNSGGLCCWLKDGEIHYFDGDQVTLSVSVGDIPITMGGAARFNVQNAMGATCLAKAMGIKNDAIIKGLTTFTSTPDDNPGRCNEFMVKGARVFVDFAHNPHSINAISDMLDNLSSKKKFLLIGQAGDRSDQDIRDLTNGAIRFNPDVVATMDMVDYLRGRELGECSAIIKIECIKHGIAEESISHFPSPSEGAQFIIDQLEEGDLVLLLALAERDKIFEMLKAAS
ncbi:MAG: Mur ligase family protein [Emcibacteraceae bacterium]|nr:Mur ligase family protein [Emcibacteraceae bacterium]MDG1996547.1 Mur ligase family protein [Emcibacteraceae bacterium]